MSERNGRLAGTSFLRERLGSQIDTGLEPGDREKELLLAVEKYLKSSGHDRVRIVADINVIDLDCTTSAGRDLKYTRLPRGHHSKQPRRDRDQRLTRIAFLINTTSMTIEQIAADVQYSEATVRNDINVLYESREIDWKPGLK